MLAFAGGLRREELSALNQSDFNTEKNTAKIERAATYIPGEGIHIGLTKTNNSERTISLPISVMKLRESYNAEQHQLSKVTLGTFLFWQLFVTKKERP